MLKQTIALFGLSLSLSLSANSATLVKDESGLIGAKNVDVDGELYNVDFLRGSCIDLFENCMQFTFTDANKAWAASNALEEQVFIGALDNNPDILTWYPGGAPQTKVYTPFELTDEGEVAIAIFKNSYLPNDDEVYLSTRDVNIQLVYASWAEVSQVPIPAAAWLFSTALLGLIGIKRKK